MTLNEKYAPCQVKGSKTMSTFAIIGRTEAEAETPILWPPDTKN